MDWILKFIINFEVYIKNYITKKKLQHREWGIQTKENQRLLKEYILLKNLFNKNKIIIISKKIIILIHLKK